MAGDSPAEKLQEAVLKDDKGTALTLLELAGGACQARKLAADAKALPSPYGTSVGWGFTVDIDSDKETISLYQHQNSFAGNNDFVVGLTQKACKTFRID